MSGQNLPFPDRLASDEEKASKKYALQFFKAATQGFSIQGDSFYARRNRSIIENRMFALGEQSTSDQLDLMGIDGKQSFINIQMAPNPVAPKLKAAFVDWYDTREEEIKAINADRTRKSRREKKKTEAKFAVDNKEFVDEFSKLTGISPSAPGTPKFTSKEQVDLFYEYSDKEREEILMETLIKFVLDNNTWDEITKRKLLSDFWDSGFAVVWNYVNENGRICVERVDTRSFFHSSSNRDDFKDSWYSGHVTPSNISEVRLMFPDLDEKQLYKIAESAARLPGTGQTFNWDWDDRYYNTSIRPYDEIKVDLVFGWYKVDKMVHIVKGTDSYGRKIYDTSNKKRNVKSPNKKSETKRIKTSYVGWWIYGTEEVLDWYEERNQYRPYNALEDVFPPYCIMMPDNDGTCSVRAPQSIIIPYLRDNDSIILKIRQIVASAPPDGYAYDLSSLEAIDVGNGQTLDPVQIIELYNQTGRLYFRRFETEDGKPVGDPIIPLNSSFGQKLQELILLYNFNMQQIVNVLGINEYRTGEGVNPKLGLGVLQTQLQNSDLATVRYYKGYINLLQSVSKAIGQRLWDALWYDSKYSDDEYSICGEYFDLIGDNVDFLKQAKDLTQSNYDIRIEIGFSDEEKAVLNQNIQSSLETKQITLEDAVFIREVKPFRLAMKYLALKQKERSEEALRIQRENQEYQARLNQQVAQSNAQSEAQLVQLKSEGEKQVKEVEADGKAELEDKKFLHEILIKSYETDKELPEYAKRLLERYTKDLNEEEQLEAQMLAQQQAIQEQNPTQNI